MKLTPDKRNKLILVAMLTAGVLALLWFALLTTQESKLKEIAAKITSAEEKERRMQLSVKAASAVEADLKIGRQKLGVVEEEMASGDLYSWMHTIIKNFKTSYRIDIPQFSSVEVGDCALIYKFHYKQAKVTLNGSAYFHDLGKFVSDLENRYPYMRLQNLQLQPATGPEHEGEQERLGFRIELITLVNSANQRLEKK